MQKREFIFTVEKTGAMPATVLGEFLSTLARFPERPIKVTISNVKKYRTDPQNRFYWGVVVPLVQRRFEEFGNIVDAEEVHRFLKGKVGGMTRPIVKKGGQVIAYVVDTSTKLSTAEWEDWLTKIRAWGADFDLQIPFPNEEVEIPLFLRPFLRRG
jgi:hypothetical protein